MKTQGINLLEAINFCMNGHSVSTYSPRVTSMDYINGRMYITSPADLFKSRTSQRLFSARDFEWLKDEKFFAGDDKSIKGYY